MNTTKTEKMPDVSHLDTDTQRSIRQVFTNGYYELHQCLGVGGWPIVYQFADDWRTYVLNASHNENEFDDKIVAKDDQTAERAFKAKYDFANCDFVSIREKTTTYREINLGNS